MTNKRWQVPPVMEASLRLQNVIQRLKRLELKRQADRASGLLKTHLQNVKKTNA